MSNDDTVTMSRSEAVALAIAAGRGEALAAWIATTALLGHSRPGSTLDYMPPPEPWSTQAFIRDFVAWTSGRDKYAPGCADRLREWGLEESALRMDRATAALAESA